MKVKPVLLVLVMAALLGAAAWWLLGAPATVVLTRDGLQREVEARFPLERTELLVTGRLSDPVVLLDAGSNRIGLRVTVRVAAPGMREVRAKGELQGRLRFDPERRELFLEAPDLRLTEAAGLGEAQLRTAEQAIRPVLATVLARVPIYRLKEEDIRFPRTNARVREIEIEEGRVVLRFAR